MSEHLDLVVRNATLVDGTGAPRYTGDIGVRADRIVEIGRVSARAGEHEIDATGLVAAPGFIDAHTHDDRLLLDAPDVAPKLSQGVTTVVTGNCGISLALTPPHGAHVPPLDLLDTEGTWFRFPDFVSYRRALEDAPPAINAACLVGHTTLRVAVMDRYDRPATAAEIARMRSLAAAALDEGAIGLSTGTAYDPAAAAPTEEIVAVCAALAATRGLYVTHMRNEDAAILPAIEETLRIGREAASPVVISHHKCIGTPNHGRSTETLALIDRARHDQPVSLDCYPYVASSTVLKPDRLAQSTRVIVTWSKPHPELAGLDLAEAARRLGCDEAAAAKKLAPAGAVYFMMSEDDVRRILAYEGTMIGSDGLPHDARPHPRLWGTFPRVLGHYARDVGLFTLETAVHKMTGLPAARFGLRDRGVLRPGAAADITLFDPATVLDAATFDDPIRPATGIAAVVVNGAVAWQEGRPTGVRRGRVLRRDPSLH